MCGSTDDGGIGLKLVILVTLMAHVIAGEERFTWSAWGSWSECSRTCDGGAAYQFRTCRSRMRCRGEAIRYRTCNSQPCLSGSEDFRAQQCSTYNDVSFRRVLHQWEPYYEPRDPCSLRCESKAFGLKVMLAPKVLDGTRCRPNSTDMCISGVCKKVGCDRVLGSLTQPDKCGVCGGDDSTCAQKSVTSSNTVRYVWIETDFSACSVSCGVGEQRTTVKCWDQVNDKPTYSLYCNQSERSLVRARTCQIARCDHVWITSEWQPCTRSCGGGISTRTTNCVLELHDGTFRRAPGTCAHPKPETRKPCNEFSCSKWVAGDWSPCSVTCGEGSQEREAICRGSRKSGCRPGEKPEIKRACTNRMPCPWDKAPNNMGTGLEMSSPKQQEQKRPRVQFEAPKPKDVTKQYGHDVTRVIAAERPPAALLQPEVEHVNFDTWLPHLLEETGSGREKPWEEENGGYAAALPMEAQALDLQQVNNWPSYVAAEWGPCTVTCGRGLRQRNVKCRVLLQFSGRIQDLPDSECSASSGDKPRITDYCVAPDCVAGGGDEPKDIYTWRMVGFTACSLTCGDGLREPIYTCVRMRDDARVEGARCGEVRLIEKQTCNDGACPPMWRLHEWGACSAACGGGFHQRRVECARETPSGHVQLLPDSQCHEPLPDRKMACNLADCPPSWGAGPWTQCSKRCGGGIQHRDVHCEQVVALGRVKKLNSSQCPMSNRPVYQKVCNKKGCPVSKKKPFIMTENSRFLQLRQMKRITFLVGQTATVIPTTSLKIRCPVKRLNKKLVLWVDPYNRTLTKKGRLKLSRGGTLRIRKSRLADTGVYTCHAGNLSANFSLYFHSGAEARQKRGIRESQIHRNAPFINIVQNLKRGIKKSNMDKISLRSLRTLNSSLILPFQYVTTPWSQCSKSCGGAGLQSRDITCELTMEDYTLIVSGLPCESRVKMKPIETQDCGFEMCPIWEPGTWSECTDALCMGVKKGAQTRLLHCMTLEGSCVDSQRCDPYDKPQSKRECRHDKCKATWRTTPWTKCSVSCGGQGVRTRSLRCVWVSSKGPAGIHCRALPRPQVVKPCNAPDCSEAVCQDHSKYCTLIPMLQLCEHPTYKQQCCRSCSNPVQYERIRYRT